MERARGSYKLVYKDIDRHSSRLLVMLNGVDRWIDRKTGKRDGFRTFRARDGGSMTVEEAKEWLRARFSKGAPCPCCHQFVKLYRRKLNSSMAYVLVLMHRGTAKGEFVHVPSFINSVGLTPEVTAAIRGDWAKLQHWGFLESEEQTREDGSSRTGWWRITTGGRQFVLGETSAPSHVHIYNGRIVRRKGAALISISEALGDRFNYAELMGMI